MKLVLERRCACLALAVSAAWAKSAVYLCVCIGYVQLSDGSLRISSVSMSDAGIYVCVAQNSAGTAMAQVRLSAHGISTTHTHTHTHAFNGPLSRTTRVGRYQKGKTNLDFTEARDSEWQRHQLGHMLVCTSLRTDNRTSTPPLSFTIVRQ